jgi:hypothetical protein
VDVEVVHHQGYLLGLWVEILTRIQCTYAHLPAHSSVADADKSAMTFL